MIALMRRYGNLEAAYLFSVVTSLGVIEVDANSVKDARDLAQRLGYQVEYISRSDSPEGGYREECAA